MKQIRKSVITKEEIIADVIFLFISAFISLLAVFLFDVHHSFYEKPIYPFKFIFKTYHPYVLFTLVGTIIGFFIIKLFLFGLREEEGDPKRPPNSSS
jgi:lysylphosphatidylglycerol synthetase-like protein (DUF2156 family)